MTVPVFRFILDIPHQLGGRDPVTVGVSGRAVPVEIDISLFLHPLRQAGHNALLVTHADGVARTAREADHLCLDPRLLLDHVRDLLKVFKVSFF